MTLDIGIVESPHDPIGGFVASGGGGGGPKMIVNWEFNPFSPWGPHSGLLRDTNLPGYISGTKGLPELS